VRGATAKTLCLLESAPDPAALSAALPKVSQNKVSHWPYHPSAEFEAAHNCSGFNCYVEVYRPRDAF
jgi:hypothetical protein